MLLDGTFWFPPEEYDPREQDWYREAEESGETVLIPLREDPKGGGSVLTLAVPVRSLYDNSRLLAVFAGDITLDALTEVMENLALPQGSLVALLDAQGNLLHLQPSGEQGEEHSEAEVSGVSESPPEIFKDLSFLRELSLNSGEMKRLSVEGLSKRVWSYALPHGLRAFFIIDEASLLAPVRRMALQQGGVSLFVAFLAGGLLYLLWKSMASPLARLDAAARSVLEGASREPLVFRGDHEIARVGRAFQEALDLQERPPGSAEKRGGCREGGIRCSGGDCLSNPGYRGAYPGGVRRSLGADGAKPGEYARRW